jgi:hypothetical protein
VNTHSQRQFGSTVMINLQCCLAAVHFVQPFCTVHAAGKSMGGKGVCHYTLTPLEPGLRL